MRLQDSVTPFEDRVDHASSPELADEHRQTDSPIPEQPVMAESAPAQTKERSVAQRQRMASPVSSSPPQKQRMGSTASPDSATAAPKQRLDTAAGAPIPSANTSPKAGPGPQSVAKSGDAAPSERQVEGHKIQEPVAAGSKTTILPRWVRPAVAALGIVLIAAVSVWVARWGRTLPAVHEFIATYPGHSPLPESSPQGVPAWLGWEHFLNMFFLALIVRTGLQVRCERRAPGYWKPKENSFFSPMGNTPKKVSLSQWLHQALDVLWVANGAVFIVMLAVTGQWMRIVPTSWALFPNMVSAAIQYASLNWPVENGWVYYNALQLAAYFLTVYVAAPLAVLSGLRMSTWWPAKATTLNKVYPLQVARALHFPVMLYFVAFTIVHVFLVFFTGALSNLNHMYTSRDVADWWGLGIFLASIFVIAAAWFLTMPVFTTPLANRMGTVTKN
ncbi:cytochrome b/b6 domain-containing protein [Arthrobacter sp. STN4]|uniref:cytochrome b/b6 domain-containing protein n=1 Tax=Arthrobacter sp. STN4 TaxID=2923276 RepID=UPI002119C1FB|nr:cytochrome b/b6 domain-containing protein [Arthrobacter sp. STN4]MCQ9163736.1 cytochrome b/b6 domain-containing protein [Arthrobacter sp. STN4]